MRAAAAIVIVVLGASSASPIPRRRSGCWERARGRWSYSPRSRNGDPDAPLTQALLGIGTANGRPLVRRQAGLVRARDPDRRRLAITVGLWQREARPIADVGGGAFVIGALVHIASAGDAVRARQQPVSILPTVGMRAGGLALGGTF